MDPAKERTFTKFANAGIRLPWFDPTRHRQRPRSMSVTNDFALRAPFIEPIPEPTNNAPLLCSQMPGGEYGAVFGKHHDHIDAFRPAQRFEGLQRCLRDRPPHVERRVHGNLDAYSSAKRLE